MPCHLQPEATAWHFDPPVFHEPSTVVYEPVQPESLVPQAAQPLEQQLIQSEHMWQSAATCMQSSNTVCSSQASDAHLARYLLQMQQQARAVQQLVQEQQRSRQQQMAREAAMRRQAALPAVRPVLGFTDLLAYWAQGLCLQRCESVYLACHLWTRVQAQVGCCLTLAHNFACQMLSVRSATSHRFSGWSFTCCICCQFSLCASRLLFGNVNSLHRCMNE